MLFFSPVEELTLFNKVQALGQWRVVLCTVISATGKAVYHLIIYRGHLQQYWLQVDTVCCTTVLSLEFYNRKQRSHSFFSTHCFTL